MFAVDCSRKHLIFVLFKRNVLRFAHRHLGTKCLVSYVIILQLIFKTYRCAVLKVQDPLEARGGKGDRAKMTNDAIQEGGRAKMKELRLESE